MSSTEDKLWWESLEGQFGLGRDHDDPRDMTVVAVIIFHNLRQQQPFMCIVFFQFQPQASVTAEKQRLPRSSIYQLKELSVSRDPPLTTMASQRNTEESLNHTCGNENGGEDGFEG